MIVLVVILIGFGHYPGPLWLLVVPVLALQFVFNTGLAMVMARLGSKTPDLAQLMPFVLRTWMYASGVMFPLDYMLRENTRFPSWVATVLEANPAAVYMEIVRYALIDGPHHQSLDGHVWLLALGWAAVVGFGGFVYFWKAEERYGRG